MKQHCSKHLKIALIISVSILVILQFFLVVFAVVKYISQRDITTKSIEGYNIPQNIYTEKNTIKHLT